MKYHNKNPTIEDIQIIRALSILNILLYYDQEDWAHYLRIFIDDTKKIFNKKSYLNNKDKMMILINYLTIVKNDPDSKNYKFKSFYELEEESFFIKSELFYREIISKLTEDSSLFFLYLQLISGSDIDYTSLNNFYKINHISLIEIKTHLLTENFYPYFFTFLAQKDLAAWNDSKTQIKNYNRNINIYSEDKYSKNKYLVNNTIKMALIKFQQYAHTQSKGNCKLFISQRYFLKDNLDCLEIQKKIIKGLNQLKNEEDTEFLDESEQTIERYIFGEEIVVKNIIYSKGQDLSQLYKSELFIKNNFCELNILVEKFKTNFNKNKINLENQQTTLGTASPISIPKLKIKKNGKLKIYTYYDLGISSTDLLK